MKKSLIALLLVVALVVTVSVFAVSAADTNPFDGATEAVIADCPYCGADQTWYPVLADWTTWQMQSWEHWDNGGHYYYTQDMTDGSSDTFTTETVCINLNGKVITRTASKWFTLSGADAATAPVLNIMDSSLEQTGEMDSGATSGNQFFTATGTGTVNVYSGIISAYGSKIAAGSGSNPTLVKADTTSAATFNFNGGTLKGYSQYTAGFMRIEGSTTVNINGATLDGKGGTNTIKVNGANAKLYLNSGSLTVGSMSSGKDGAICVEGGAYFEMNGGTLTGNNTHASSFGGAVRVTNGEVVLNGGTITGSAVQAGGVYATGSNARVTLNGATFDGCTATAAAANQVGGGAVKVNSSATFTMLKGTIQNCSAGHGGAVMAIGATFDMQGGTIQDCTASSQGGAFYASGSAGKILMSGDTIKSCTAGNSGGALLIQYQSQGSIISGTALIEECSAPLGGAVALNGSGVPTLTMNGGTIQNCSATKSSGAMGGSIYDMSSAGAVVNLNGGTVSGGSAADGDGGNIYITKAASQLNIAGGTVTKGTALRVNGTSKGNGGNIYMAAGTLNISDGTVSGGLDTNNSQHAGNIYAGGATVNITGGTITGGKCGSYGGNIYAYDCALTIDAAEGKTVKITNGQSNAGGNIYIRETASSTDTASATITGPDVTISGGSDGSSIGSAGQNGSQIMLFGVEANPCVLDLTDVNIDSSEVHTNEVVLYAYAQLNVAGEKNVDCAYIVNDTSRVTVKEGFTGMLWVRWYDSDISAAVTAGAATDPTLWQEAGYVGTGTVYACDGSRSQKILVDTGDAVEADADAGTAADNKFVVAGFEGVKADTEGNITFTPIADLTTADQYDFVKAYFGGEYTLSSDTTLDINNNILHINTGDYKLNLIEQRTSEFEDAADYTTKGYVTVDNEANVNTVVRENANDYQYIVVPTGTTEEQLTKFTAHRVKVDIDTVSIKPASAGLYYTTNMDTTPTASVFAMSYGVVLSLVDMPGANFVDDDSNEDGKVDNLYTEIDFELADGERVNVDGTTSALLTGILNKGDNIPAEQNRTWGAMPVYANAFVCFNINGVDHYVMADQSYELSLLDILKIVNDTAPASAVGMYETWEDPMAYWATEIPADTEYTEPPLAAIKAAYDEANA